MIYCINPKEIEKEDIDKCTFLAALSLYLNDYNPQHAFEQLCYKGLIEYDGFDLLNQPLNPRLSPVGITKVESVLSRSKRTNPEHDEKRLDTLAQALMDEFPVGKKGDTNKYWKGNKRENIRALERFFLKYGYSTYTDEQIIEAARRYINPPDGDRTTCRILQYFIIKNIQDIDENGRGFIREVSDLATYLDNPETETTAVTDKGELI